MGLCHQLATSHCHEDSPQSSGVYTRAGFDLPWRVKRAADVQKMNHFVYGGKFPWGLTGVSSEGAPV